MEAVSFPSQLLDGAIFGLDYSVERPHLCLDRIHAFLKTLILPREKQYLCVARSSGDGSLTNIYTVFHLLMP